MLTNAETIKERPILFSGAMVRALLDGSKTQTRRIIKSPTGTFEINSTLDTKQCWLNVTDANEEAIRPLLCPYGQPGDRLWVRETWAARYQNCSCYIQPCDCTQVVVSYVADGASRVFDDHSISEGWQMPKAVEAGKNGPCLFMPRWASRLLLEITAVRCERLQDISEADAVAEGVNLTNTNSKGGEEWENYLDEWAFEYFAKDSYATLWEKINGLQSWAANPWVWVVEFRVLSNDGKEAARV